MVRLLPLALVIGAAVGPLAPDGTEPHCDLPLEFHVKNVSSRGQGCCTQTSVGHSARWQEVPALIHMEKWVQEKGLPGGSYPDEMARRIPACCKDRGYSTADFIQVQDKDIEILKLACRTGRMPGVTYSFSPTGRYGGAKISHMVSLVHADDKWFAILDNNYPGSLEWLTPDEFKRTYCGRGDGWAVILLDPGPPPPPSN